MRVQISLDLEIKLIVFAHIMIDQSEGHQQWDISFAVLLKYFQRFLLFICGKLLFEVTQINVKTFLLLFSLTRSFFQVLPDSGA